MDESKLFLQDFSETDPKQLRQVIEALIGKSRVLLQNLEETWEKLEEVESEKTFWKENYINLRQACQHYVDSNGLAPFTYLAALQQELKQEKVHKSCLEEKLKVMVPSNRPSPMQRDTPSKSKIGPKNIEFFKFREQKPQ